MPSIYERIVDLSGRFAEAERQGVDLTFSQAAETLGIEPNENAHPVRQIPNLLATGMLGSVGRWLSRREE